MTSVGSSLRVTVMFAIVFTEMQLLVTEKDAVQVATWMTLNCFLQLIKSTGD